MPNLSPTEARVLDVAAQGLTPRDIARQLGVETTSVRNAITRARRKLGARDLHHAIQIHTTRTPQES